MILNRNGATFLYDGIAYTVGAKVYANKESEYHGLFGTIIEIRDGDDKDTENDTPDIYCEFLPPILPDEIKKLEATFTALYRQKKTLNDIALDMVIMAPDMLDILQSESIHQITVYLVREEWSLDGNSGIEIYPAADFIHARQLFTEKICDDKAEGCMSQWMGRDDVESQITQTCYEYWLRDSYFENHIKLTIEEYTVPLGSSVFAEIGDHFIDHKLRQAFAEQTEDWEELSDLTEAQIAEMIQQDSVPELIRSQLKQNGNLEEEYWQSVSEASFKLVKKYKDSLCGGSK